MATAAPDHAGTIGMQPLVVLLTNFELDVRGGSQLYARDVALGLLKRGHTPIVYAPKLGDVARELAAATVPVTDDLATLSAPPDVIHGHHNHELLIALLRFPAAPAVRVCHGWLDDRPQRFPRILRYLAVDDTTRDRCLYEWGVPAERLDVLLNFADLDRFAPRRTLPARPTRALVFSHTAREHLWVVQKGCAPLGISVDAVGQSLGNATASPEHLLPHYDIVFAKGRAALEAAASGAAVVLCDRAGLGPMVTAAELPGLRRLNFGIRSLNRELSAEAIREELDRYDPADAREVTRRIRATASADAAVDSLVACYRDVLAEHRQSHRDAEGEFRAASAYLQSISPRIHWTETPAAARSLFLKAMYLSTADLPGVRSLVRTSWVRRLVLSARDWRRRLTATGETVVDGRSVDRRS